MNLALAYYKSARPNLAIPELRRVVASEPNARNAYLVLAECYLQTGQDQELVALLKPRAQMFGNGNDPAYAYLLGTALLHNERGHRRAEVQLNVVFGAGESAEANLLMGMAHLSRQDFRGAKAKLELAVKLNPRLPTAQSLYRAIAARAWRAGRRRARVPPGAGSERQRFRSEPADGPHPAQSSETG